MKKRTHLLCLTAFALLCVHSASSIDDLFAVLLSPEPWNTGVVLHQVSQDCDVAAPVDTSIDDILSDIYVSTIPTTHAAQAPVKQQDMLWVDAMLDAYLWPLQQSQATPQVATSQGQGSLSPINTFLGTQSSPAQTVTQNQDILSTLCSFLGEYPWLPQFDHITMSPPHSTVLGTVTNIGTTFVQPYICQVCGDLCKDQRDFRAHVDAHIEARKQEKHPCGVCPAKFPTKIALKQHCRDIHNVIEVPKFYCEQCRKMFHRERDMRNHEKKHAAPDTQYPCNLCNKICKDKNSLTSHLSAHKKAAKRPPKPPGGYVCTTCSRVCRNTFSLSQHMKVHAGSQPRIDPSVTYPCSKCITVCTSQSGLTQHEISAHPILGIASNDWRLTDPDYLARKYPCKECFRRFVKSDGLLHHVLRAHTTRDLPAPITGGSSPITHHRWIITHHRWIITDEIR